MKRDGTCTSIWQTDMPDYDRKSTNVAEDKIFDVIIVGGGITGITTGLLLQNAGKEVLIAEAQSICFGTTGGTTAHLNSFFETPFNKISKNFSKEKAELVAKGLKEAMNLIKKNVWEYKIECGYKELPAYLFAQNEKQIEDLDEFFEGFEQVGQEVSVCNTIPVKIPFEKAFELPGQAQIHPAQYVYGLAKQFEKAGGVIMQDCRVMGVEEGDTLEVNSTTGVFKAKNLIYATHIPPGVNLLHFRCAPYRSYVIGVKLKDDNDYPKGLAYDMADPYHYFRTQEVDGEKYLIAGGEDHKTAHEENTEACYAKLEAYIRMYYDVESVPFKWSSQYYNPTDGLPYIGHLPGHQQNMFVATGYGGVGMTGSHLAAITLSDIIVKGESEYQHVFNPNRIKPVAGFSNFVKEAADVVGRFIGDKLLREKITDLAEMAPGEARVVKYEGHTLALYKDEKGALHAVNSACTHIKCTVGWNTAEKSWDCPCHGSRFSFDGTMLTGPARKDLELLSLNEIIEK